MTEYEKWAKTAARAAAALQDPNLSPDVAAVHTSAMQMALNKMTAHYGLKPVTGAA